jgi:CRISPR/Cas system-associated exonuclease Cas4 (RecB family)
VPELEGCLRRGVYERTHWEQKELYDAKLQLIFDEGHNQEASILRDFAEAGINIIEQQTPYEWKEHQITGHVDGKYVEDGVAYPIEIKSMSPHIFSTVNSFEDFKKKPWTRSYMAQITIYMLMQGIDKAIFILKNKSTGELKQITVDLDYVLGEACLKTAEAINGHIKARTLPDRIKDIDKCSECPFKTLCLPDVSWGTPLKICDDPEFQKKLETYLSLEAQSKANEKLYETIRERAAASADEKGNLNILVGPYNLTGKKDARGAFRLKIGAV